MCGDIWFTAAERILRGGQEKSNIFCLDPINGTPFRKEVKIAKQFTNLWHFQRYKGSNVASLFLFFFLLLAVPAYLYSSGTLYFRISQAISDSVSPHCGGSQYQWHHRLSLTCTGWHLHRALRMPGTFCCVWLLLVLYFHPYFLCLFSSLLHLSVFREANTGIMEVNCSESIWTQHVNFEIVSHMLTCLAFCRGLELCSEWVQPHFYSVLSPLPARRLRGGWEFMLCSPPQPISVPISAGLYQPVCTCVFLVLENSVSTVSQMLALRRSRFP